MANEGGIQHFTPIDFDISGIANSLKQVETMLETTAKQINSDPKYKIDVFGSDNATKEASTQTKELSNSTKELGNTYKETNTSANNMLKTITDKARWLSAFYLISTLITAFREMITTIKSTEDRVVELQRVLGDVVSGEDMQNTIYNLAIEYGRSFDEVSEAAVKFAQAGYEWIEVLELTESTMLALNTAELDVTDATTGLIAVMSQFKLEAEDLELIIDKINTTADNFPVTSEKIVTALQRAGGAANNANVSLEETIAIITSLSASTGRSGEVIGTAVNSLIAFSQKSSSMEIFRSLSDEMSNLVDDFNTGTASIVDVWQGLSKEITSAEGQQSLLLEQLYASDDFTAFADELETNASELTDTIRDVYSTAGTNRQNYFIGLLSELSGADKTYEQVLSNVTDAQGYSLDENAKQMETLTAKTNQLVESMRLLAVEFGEDGFENFLKFLVDSGINITELIDTMGGLNIIVAGLLLIFSQIKKQELSKVWNVLGDSLTNLKINMQTAKVQASLFKLELQSAPTVATKTQVAFSALSGTVKSLGAAFLSLGPLGMASVVYAGFTIINGIIDKNIEKTKERIDLGTENINAWQDEQDAINDTINSYIELNQIEENGNIGNREEILALQKEIAEYTNLEFSNIAETNEALKMQIALQKLATLEQLTSQENLNKVQQAYEDVNNEVDKALQTNLLNLAAMKQYNQVDFSNIAQAFNPLENSQQGLATIGSFMSEDYYNSESLEEAKQSLIDLQTQLLALEDSSARTKGLQDISDQLEVLNPLLLDAEEKTKAYNEQIAAQSLLDFGAIYDIEGLNTYIETQEKIIETAKEDEQEKQNQAQANIDYANSFYSYLIPSLDTATESLGGFTYNAEQTAEEIERLTEEIDNVQSSFSTMMNTMNTYNTTGVMTIDMVQELLSLEGQYFASLNITAQGISMVDQNTGKLINSSQGLIKQLVIEQGARQVLDIITQYQTESTKESGTEADNAKSKYGYLEGQLQSLIEQYLNGTITISAFNNSLKGEELGVSGERQQAMINDIGNALNNLKGIYGQVQNIAGTSQQWVGDISDTLKKQNELAIKNLEAQKQAVEDRYNAEIEALRAVEEENDRIRAKQDYELEKAELSARSGVEYREQESDLDLEWQRQLEDWSLEDRIAELERLRDAEVSVIEAQIETLRNGVQSISNTMISSAANTTGTMLDTYASDYVEPTVEIFSQAIEETQQNTLSSTEQWAIETGKMFNEHFIQPMNIVMADMFTRQFVDYAQIGAIGMYGAYKTNFIDKLNADIQTMFLYSLSSQASIASQLGLNTYTGIPSVQNNTSNYQNSRSMTMLINNQNQNDGNKIVKNVQGMFDNSTLPF